MTNNREEEPLELKDVPPEEGVTGEDAAEQLSESPEDKDNFTETHPEEARRQREKLVGDDPEP